MTELEQLRRQVEALTGRVAALEYGTEGCAVIMRALGVTFTQAQMLALLLKRPFVSCEALWSTLYGQRCSQPEPHVLKAHMALLRRRMLDQGGAGIITVRAGKHQGPLAGGWFMRPEDRVRLHATIKEAVRAQ